MCGRQDLVISYFEFLVIAFVLRMHVEDEDGAKSVQTRRVQEKERDTDSRLHRRRTPDHREPSSVLFFPASSDLMEAKMADHISSILQTSMLGMG